MRLMMIIRYHGTRCNIVIATNERRFRLKVIYGDFINVVYRRAHGIVIKQNVNFLCNDDSTSLTESGFPWDNLVFVG